MTMTRLKISKTLLAVMLTSAVATGSAYAENNAQTTNESAGQKVDSSMNKVGNFMDDSAITAKVKAALVDHDNIKSTDISVKTDQKVVTLSGFVESQAQAEEAVKVAKGVEGGTPGSEKLQDNLHFRDAKEGSVKGYAGDTATTSEIKAKLLADDIVPSRHVKVETTDGVVQLSGTVDSQAQSDRAESIAKAVDGVKSVKNDLKTK
ncbi:molecular chaperone OsmY [Escherichia coli]|uniref:molecular chaperone OsmY n=1 Tax=Escherichia coli TaxID=562 RepID=UPI00136AD3B6|nr:molecular chaperone OsmY [Escherichia coli]MXR73201.1 molecular chaperone OsmY [Escherichia coli]